MKKIQKMPRNIQSFAPSALHNVAPKMKTTLIQGPIHEKFLRNGLLFGLVLCGVLSATVNSASASLYIDFEAPTYTSGAPLNGQAGWTAGSANYVNTPAIAGSASAFVYEQNTGPAVFSIASQSFSEITLFSGLIRANDPAAYSLSSSTAIVLLTNTESNTYIAFLANDNTFSYLNSDRTAWNSTGISYSYGDILSFEATLNFTTQTFDLTVTNLTTSSGTFLNSLSFSDPTTIAQASGLLQLGGQSASYDNLSLQAVPEPSTGLLLGLGCAACAALSRRPRNVGQVTR
jgi:hypothetical protein